MSRFTCSMSSVGFGRRVNSLATLGGVGGLGVSRSANLIARGTLPLGMAASWKKASLNRP